MSVAAAESAWWIREKPEPRGKAEGSVAFIALTAFTCVLLLNPQTWILILRPLRIAFVSAGFAASSLLWAHWRERKPLVLSREIVTCFLLLLWACMTIPVSFWPGGSVATLANDYSKAVIVFWLLASVIVTERRLFVLTIVLIACSVPIAAIALKNYTTGSFLPDSDVVTRITGYGKGMSANLNDLALMLNLILPLSIAHLLSATRAWARTASVAVIALTIVAVIITFSRAGFLGLATMTALYVLRMMRRRGRDRRWAIVLAVAAVMSIPLVPSSYVDRISTVTHVDADPTGSSQARWRDMVAAARYVSQNPILGAGIGMDIFALNEVRGDAWVQVHNVYLQYAVDLGIPGAALFLVLLCSVFVAARNARKQLADRPEHRPLFLTVEALETSLVVFAVSGLFYPIAYKLFFYYFGGLALGARAVTRQVLST